MCIRAKILYFRVYGSIFDGDVILLPFLGTRSHTPLLLRGLNKLQAWATTW